MPSVNALRFDLGPLAEAVKRISAKTPLGTALRSKELETLPLAIRERAQFSAQVESARILSQIQRSLEQNLRATGDGLVMSRERFAAKLLDVAKQELGDAPRKGGMQDIRSVGRARMIYDMQTQQAYGQAQWNVDTDPENLNAVPAQEFKRLEPRKKPREDWGQRWQRAGGKLYGGRMIALKTDPVWMELSRFGTPWPPYDYQSGMGVVDIYRDEAEALGLVQPGVRLEATQQQDFNDALEASVKDVTPELRRMLESVGIKVQGDKAKPAETKEGSDAVATRILTGNDEAERWGSKTSGAWAKKVKPNEKKALDVYQGSSTGHGIINAVARGDDRYYLYGQKIAIDPADRPVWEQKVKAIRSALDKASIPEPVRVYRGTDAMDELKLRVADIDEKMVGLSYPVRGFKSTSLIPDKLHVFTDRKPDAVVLEIDVPAGAKAAYLNTLKMPSGMENERELLITDSGKFVVTGIGKRYVQGVGDIPVVKMRYEP